MSEQFSNVTSAIIGAGIALSGVFLNSYLNMREKNRELVRHRGREIEILANEYEREAKRYWSSAVHDQECARNINSLKRRIGNEISSLAQRKKLNCRKCEAALIILHRAATLHDNFNTKDREANGGIVLHIQDFAEEFRYAIRADLDIT